MIDLVARFKQFLGFPDAQGALSMPSTRRELHQQFERHRIATLLPWESWDPESRLYHNADGFGFVLECNPATGLGEDDAKAIAGILNQNLPPNTALQFCLWASPTIMPQLTDWARGRLRNSDRPRNPADQAQQAHAEKRAEGPFALVARRRVEHLAPAAWRSLMSTEPMLVRNFRLVISVCFPKPSPSSRAGDERTAEQTATALIGALATVGIQADHMPADDFVDFVDDLVNPRFGREPKRHSRSWDEYTPLRDQVPQPDTRLVVYPDHLRINDTEVRCLTATSYPKQWWLSAMDQLIGDFFEGIKRFPCPFLLTTSIFIPDQVNAKQIAKVKAARATQATHSPIARFVPSWYEKKAEWDYVNEKVDEGHTLCQVAHQLLIYSPAGEGEIQLQNVRSLLGGKGWDFVPDRYLQIPAFMSALPMTLSQPLYKDLKQFNRMKTMLTWTAANLIPLIAEWKGIRKPGDDQYPLMQFVGRRGQLMEWDPFANTAGNYNIAVAAASGSGKSFLTQELIMNMLSSRGRCWVIDAGESYRWICKLLGGEYLEFSQTSRICLNPFTAIEDWEDGIAMLKPLVAQMAFPNDKPSDFQMAAIEKALNEAWRSRGNEATITDIRDILASHPDRRIQDIAEHLYPYCKEGMHGRWFEGPANIDLDSRFMVLELGELNNKPDLQTVVLMLLMMRIAQTMYAGNRSVRKMCIIDEAWRLLASGRAGSFIEEGYRIVRKFGGLFCTITQGINDYYKSPVAEAAFENSDWVLLLRQKPEAIDQLDRAEKLSMTEYKKRVLKSLTTVAGAYSELMINGPGGWTVARLVVDPFTAKLYSTTADDFERIRRLTEAGHSVEEAVSMLVSGQNGGRPS